MSHPGILRISKSMPYMSEMMTDMYMDIVIKEYNDPQPSTTQEYNTSPHTARPYLPSTKATKDLESVKKLQAEIALLEEMKKGQSEKGLSTTMRTAVDERILELRRSADPLVEILSREEVGESENVGAGETAGRWVFSSEVDNKHLYQEAPVQHYAE